MKKISFFGFLSMLILPNMTIAQSWSWETTFPNATINDIKTLPSGTTYIVGDFTQLTPKDSTSASDYFLIKVDSSGNIIGGFKKGPDDLGIGQLLGIDNEGNVYVVGMPFVPVANNYYLHKYTVDGSTLWARKLYIEGGVKAMDVNYGRIGLTGHYKKVMFIYDFDNVKVTKNLGEYCDPEWEYPCAANYFDAFVVNLDYNGGFVWADNFYSEMRPGYDEGNVYPFTKDDYDDRGVDIVIDKNQNTIFQGLFSTDADWPKYMIIGSIKLPFGNLEHLPYTIAKFDPNGNARWAEIQKKGINYTFPNKRISTDYIGNIYQLTEYVGNQGASIMMYKRKPNGTVIWQKLIGPETGDTFYPEIWTWYPDSLGNHYAYSEFSIGFEGNTNGRQKLFLNINKDGELIKEFAQPENFQSSATGADSDQNLYFQRSNSLRKFILKEPSAYNFIGNGLWSTIENWENEMPPPLTLPKWDTIYIQTTDDDSCVLDVQQVIPEGALLKIEPGSRFIVPGDILTGPIAPNPTPILATALANPQGKAGDTLLFKVQVIPGEHPVSSGIEVSIDLTSTGGPLSLLLNDNGMLGDEEEGDGIYSIRHALTDSVKPGPRMVPYKVNDAQMRADSGEFVVTVLPTPQPEIVISQIYTGGGISGAAYRNDFIELFNRSEEPVSLEGKSVQIASGDGIDLFSANPPILLSGTIAPGQYYLIGLAGGAKGAVLPQEDANANFDLSDAGGKIIIVSDHNGLPCNGGSTPCDTEQIGKILDLVGYGNANFFETKAVPVSIRPRATVYLRNWEGVQDTQNNSLDFNNALPTPRNKNSKHNPPLAKVVISQVYTIGGTSNKSYKNDFIELYNDGNKAESLYGWSVQYAEAGATNWQSTPLSGILKPGQFILISQAAGATGSNLPAADIQGNIDMNTTGGTVLLVKSSDLQTGECPNGEQIADKVGYGNASCFEGSGPTTATTTIRWQYSGSLDSGNNQNDFNTGPAYPRNSSFPIFSNRYRNGESVLVDTRDNKTYPIKRIGLNIWTLRNLNYNKSGSFIYDDNPSNAAIYGRLYYWEEAMDGCPTGWHLPSNGEWSSLITTAGGGGILKDTLYWNAPNTGATNSIGFSARPGGTHYYDYEGMGDYGYWWTSNYSTSTGVIHWATVFFMHWNSTQINNYEIDIGRIFSVRCVKD